MRRNHGNNKNKITEKNYRRIDVLVSRFSRLLHYTFYSLCSRFRLHQCMKRSYITVQCLQNHRLNFILFLRIYTKQRRSLFALIKNRMSIYAKEVCKDKPEHLRSWRLQYRLKTFVAQIFIFAVM